METGLFIKLGTSEQPVTEKRASVIKLAYRITETEHIRQALNKFNECNVNNVYLV